MIQTVPVLQLFFAGQKNHSVFVVSIFEHKRKNEGNPDLCKGH
jgi:hypothetical protein